MPQPTLDSIRAAHARIKPHIHRTPVLSSHVLNSKVGAEIYFKCENFQKVGAFKARGACNAVMSLTDDQARRGVVTHSSGNHGAALALAARSASGMARTSWRGASMVYAPPLAPGRTRNSRKRC